MLKDCESVSESVSEIIEYRAAASQLKNKQKTREYHMQTKPKMQKWNECVKKIKNIKNEGGNNNFLFK